MRSDLNGPAIRFGFWSSIGHGAAFVAVLAFVIWALCQ